MHFPAMVMVHSYPQKEDRLLDGTAGSTSPCVIALPTEKGVFKQDKAPAHRVRKQG